MKNFQIPAFSILFCLFLGAGINLFAQVDQDELSKNLGPVVFINYEGPHSRIETRAQIRNIGYALGLQVRDGAGRGGSSNRYFVIHSVSPLDGNKLDADIFGLGVDTGVDHIRNLRWIVQGYLEAAYGYAERDAAVIAEYVTIYNAVYRGDRNYFGGRYKTPVIQNLTPERAGISIRFDEWPGRTLMLIPLGTGGLSSVDTTSLTGERVVDEMRKEDDRGVDSRRGMVDLKEREAAEAEQSAAVKREAIREEERRIAEERAANNRDRDRIAGEQRQNQEDAAAGRKTPEEAAQKDQELADNQKEADQKSEELDEREDQLAAKRESADQDEAFSERKTEEAQREREDIAKDQQALIDQENAQGGPGILGALIEKSDTSIGRLVKLSPASKEELKRSPLETLNVRTLTFLNGKILAIAGENKGNGAIRLIEISGDSLEMAKQGDDDISPNSLLWVNGSDLYAINVYQDKLYIARFNSDLVRQARSAVEVHPYASVVVNGNYLLTQRGDGSAVLLNPGDLGEAQ
jgi:hypothetical protein